MADIIQFPVHDDDVDAIFERATQQIAIVANAAGEIALSAEGATPEDYLQMLRIATEEMEARLDNPEN